MASGYSGYVDVADVAWKVQDDLMKLPPKREGEPEWLQVQRRLRFNDAGREIWFGRVLGSWSYFPVHWKGLAILLASIALTGTTCVLIDRDMSGIFAVPMFIGIAVSIWICERHSSKRS